MTLTVGFVALARPTFDVPLAQEVTTAARATLHAAGFTLVGPEALLATLDEVRVAAADLTAAPLDALVVFQATFADGTLVMHLAQTVDAPLLLWALPEAPTGDRLRLNSFCGINLGAHGLKRAGLRYATLYAPPTDAAGMEQLRVLAQAGRARRLLRGARVGRVGDHPAGFDPCKLDRDGLRAHFGVEIVQLVLDDVFARARAVTEEDITTMLNGLNGQLAGLDTLDQPALQRSAATYLTLRRFADEQGLAGLAVRCWPEFFTELGCAACGAMSLLSDSLTPCSCEADINGTVTQLLLQGLSGTPAFGTDMVAFDVDKDQAVVWHCGLAPLSMADPEFQPRATIHSNRKLPLLMEFPLKPGPVTIARLSEAQGDGRYRLVVGSGEMLRAPLSFSGTSGVLRFARPVAAVLETILGEGLEHHISLTYGNHLPALVKLAELLEIPVLYL